jgi:1-acyl-sn-glycerol-3-phosphate acyltransferase
LGWPEVRAATRLAHVGLLLAGALLLAHLVVPRLAPPRRLALVQRGSRLLLRALDIELVAPDPPREAGLLIANHISWIDILAIVSVAPAWFVAKQEVRRWPVIGALASRAGTVFLVRERARAVVAANASIVDRLRRGETVVVFPEGTTTDGIGVRPFHAALLEPARMAGRPVHPVAISYHEPGGRRSLAAAYCADTSFAASLVRVARASKIRAHLRFLEPLPTAGAHRRELARAARDRIEEALQAPGPTRMTQS